MSKHKAALTSQQRKSDLKGYAAEEKEDRRQWKWTGKYSSEDYRTMFHLVRNHEKRNGSELMGYCVLAVCLTKCLEASGYFHPDQPSDEDLQYAAGLMLRYLQIAVANTDELYIRERKPERFVDLGSGHGINNRGSGVFSSFSIMNHSCAPNAFRYPVGTNLVVRARYAIKKGEAV